MLLGVKSWSERSGGGDVKVDESLGEGDGLVGLSTEGLGNDALLKVVRRRAACGFGDEGGEAMFAAEERMVSGLLFSRGGRKDGSMGLRIERWSKADAACLREHSSVAEADSWTVGRGSDSSGKDGAVITGISSE